MSEFEDAIKPIASILNQLSTNNEATYEYQAFSDALVWSDELPQNGFEDSEQGLRSEQALLYLFRYRTSVILGKPIEVIQPYWEIARKLFPSWPGFANERCKCSETLTAYVREARGELDCFLDEETT